MADRKVTDEQILAVIGDCRHPDGAINRYKLSRILGVSRPTIEPRIARLARLGMLGFDPVLPGFAVKSTSSQLNEVGDVEKSWVKQAPLGEQFEIPEGHSVKGVSALVDAGGNTIQKWIKTKDGDIDPAQIVADLQNHFATFEPAAPACGIPEQEYSDQLAVYPWGDPHFGMMAWGKEADKDWDLKIAVETVRATFSKVVERTPATTKAILLVGGDTLHSDNNDNRTNKSGNPLQVDGRYPKILLTACETIVSIISMMLGKHVDIDVIVLPGNHDEHSAFAIAFFLHAWYRSEPRVSVDISPSLFRFREFGKVMIATHHGHTTKVKDMPGHMASRQPEMWGRTVHRFALGFHIHHSSRTESAGVIMETFQILAPTDAWHYNASYGAGRSLQSITYDREIGEVGRSRVAVI